MNSKLNLLTAFICFTLNPLVFSQHSLYFDGVDDAVNVGNPIDVQITGAAITCEAWIYPTSWTAQAWSGNIICKEQTAPGGGYGYMLRAGANGTLNFAFGSGPWNNLDTDPGELVLNTWQHVAGTYDGTMSRVYINGIQIDSLAVTTAISNASTADLNIGANISLSRYFPGKIDEVRVWDIVRSQAEIAGSMNSELCTFTGLKAYYQFNQGIANGTNPSIITVADSSGNGNDGIISNMTLAGTGSNWSTGVNLTPSFPASLVFNDTNEICSGGQRMGSINLDNSANSTFSYTVLIDGIGMSNIGSNLYREDTLGVGNYEVIVSYNNGCKDTSVRTLVAGGGFEVTTGFSDDTCNTSTGAIYLDVLNNTLAGTIIYNDTLYSKDSILFVQDNTFDSLLAGTNVNPAILLNITKDEITDVCSASNNPVFTIPNHIFTTELNFGYNNFCRDMNGIVSSIPAFANGNYSFSTTPFSSLASINSITGEISNAEDNDSYTITYSYGSCSYVHPSIVGLDVPDPTFAMDNFCANDNSTTPIPVNAGGVYCLISQPALTESINTSSGSLVKSTPEYSTGNYSIKYNTNDADCPRNDTITIEVYGSPTLDTLTTEGNYLNADAFDVDSISFCPNTISLDSITSLYSSNNWIKPTGDTIMSNSSYQVDLSADDSLYFLKYFYTVPTATIGLECKSNLDSVLIQVFKTAILPNILNGDTAYCEGDSPLSLENNASTSSVNWYLNGNSLSNQVLTGSNYYLINGPYNNSLNTIYAQDSTGIGCVSDNDSTFLIFNQLPNKPTIATMQLKYCSYDLVDTLFIEPGSNGCWFNNAATINPIASGTDFYSSSNTIIDSIQYFVSVYDELTECYSLFDSITLYQNIPLGYISTELAEVCIGYSQDIEALGGVSYLWSTSDTSFTISIAPILDTWYFVEIVDINNCKNKDSIQVLLKHPFDCEETVYTAFSPNGDGVNEFWEITGIEAFKDPVVYIFNRWGDQIAKIENFDNGQKVWDGVNQKTNLPVVFGTYYYIFEDGGNKVKDGWVQVVK